MGFQLRIGKDFPPDPIDLDTVELSHSYIENRLTIAGLRRYMQPPHEPVPHLPGLTEQAAALFASGEGPGIVRLWSDVFAETLKSLDDDHRKLAESLYAADDIAEIVDAQTVALGGLSAKLIAATDVDALLK